MWKAVMVKPGEKYYQGTVHIGSHSPSQEDNAKKVAKQHNDAGVPRPKGWNKPEETLNIYSWPHGYWFVQWFDEPEVNEFGPVSP